MAQLGGPANPSLIERWIGILPVPFVPAATVWAVLLELALLFAAYLDTGNLDTAFQVASNCSQGCTSLQQGSSVVNGFFFLFLPGIMTRRMRLRLVTAEPVLSSISSNGSLAFGSVFASISRKLPQVALIVPVLGLSFVFAPSSLVNSSAPVFNSAYLLVNAVGLVGLGSFVWTYFAALRGVHRFGSLHLMLRDPGTDATQGAKPLGSITLSVTASYFGTVASGLLYVLGSNSIFSVLLIGTLTVFGAVMFFLPLNNLHQKMRQNKDSALARRRGQLTELALKTGDSELESENSATVGVWKLIGTDILEKKTSSAHTWPFDTSILNRFIVIVLSVTAALVVAVVRDLLRF